MARRSRSRVRMSDLSFEDRHLFDVVDMNHIKQKLNDFITLEIAARLGPFRFEAHQVVETFYNPDMLHHARMLHPYISPSAMWVSVPVSHAGEHLSLMINFAPTTYVPLQAGACLRSPEGPLLDYIEGALRIVDEWQVVSETVDFLDHTSMSVVKHYFPAIRHFLGAPEWHAPPKRIPDCPEIVGILPKLREATALCGRIPFLEKLPRPAQSSVMAATMVYRDYSLQLWEPADEVAAAV